MKRNRFAAIAALVSLSLAMPAAAHAMSQAEKIRRLDIMLMVTALRCRSSASDFMQDYGRFTSAHMHALNAANAQLHGEMVRRHGHNGAQRALDRFSTVMANDYGQGHPWLDCNELRMVARNLARADGTAPLEEAAGQLLADRAPPRLARAGR